MPEHRDDRGYAEPPPPLADIVDSAVRRMSTANSIAGALIALAIYSRPGPPSFEAFSTGSSIVRVNTRTGTVLECVGDRCGVVVQRGQHLEDELPAKALPAPPQAAPAPAPPAQPAPAAAPSRPAPQPGNSAG